MKNILYIFVLALLFSCGNETKSEQKSVAKTADEVENTKQSATTAVTSESEIPILNFEEFEKYLNIEDDNIHVVNFWATWCAPCVKELPYFEAVHEKYKNQNVKVLFVSLDFNLKKLNTFLAKNELKAEKVLLDDPDQNAWIPKVSKEWSGAIPATVIYGNGKRKFFEKSFTQKELETELNYFLN